MLQSVLAEAKEFLDVGNLGNLRINQRVNMSHVVLEIKIVEKLWGNNPENKDKLSQKKMICNCGID